jgi:hypothetical protein
MEMALVLMLVGNLEHFTLSTDELQQCAHYNKEVLLCSPSVVYSMDTNPHCILDIIFHRTEKYTCPVGCPTKNIKYDFR